MFAAGTGKRLCKSNIRVAAPVRAGMVIETLSAADDAMITSQNCRFVFTPMPRFDAHTAACVVRFAGLRPACPVNPKVQSAIAARPARRKGGRTRQSPTASGTHGPIAVIDSVPFREPP